MPSALLRRAGMATAAAFAAIAAMSCTDRPQSTEPAAPGHGTPGAPGTPVPLVAVDCTGSLQARTVTCGSQAPATGAHGDLIVGGQNVYMKLTSSNAAYNSGTGQFTFDVTLQNLIPQPLGTTDGTTLDPTGVRVFFNEGPTVTSGSGSASVVPDGFATFLSAGQPYYQYNQVLAQNAVSGARTWTLIMPPTVTTFAFRVYVAAPVEYPNGYVLLDGKLPGASYGSLHPADPHSVTAVVQNQVGDVLSDPVTFGTTDPGCATVSGAGVVNGVRAATCSITATAGTRSGSLVVSVTGATRTWNGSVSTDWGTDANWDALAPGVAAAVPASADSVVIPSPVPNYPVIGGATAIGGVTVNNGASLTLGGFDLTASANVAALGTGAIVSTTGRLVLAGTGKTVEGTVPKLFVTGTYSLSADATATAPVMVRGQIRSVGRKLRQVP